MKRFAMWATTVTTILVLGGQILGGTISSLEWSGVFVGAKTPATPAAIHSTVGTSNTTAKIGIAGTASPADSRSDAAPTTTIEAPPETSAAVIVAEAAPAPAPAPTAAEAPACPAALTGTIGGAPGRTAGGGMITGTRSSDLADFALTYNSIRVAHCLPPVPTANFRYDACMEDRLIWMAEDPSTDPASAWGHLGSVRSDSVPSVGCDGNLAGGSDNSGATVATKWWESLSHRASLYKPEYTGATDAVCIYFAMTHGGVPDEASSFARAAARFGSC